MIISRGRNYIFAHIPKTGGTALAMALETRAMHDDILIGDTPKAQAAQGAAPRPASCGAYLETQHGGRHGGRC